ncbi:single-stranded DNA-binding protein [Candidatus Parcubacteria bacterium]|nr:single-stranded DNA-binding protein [Candidatus Parcubacteria bacterium]
MARSVNMAIVVGNLTRDPEMRYTPKGHAVTSFSVATNRAWQSDGEQREDVEFHNVVAWNKLAEICTQLLSKGRKVYIQGRLKTRNWEDQNGVRHYRTEIVADEMVVLDRKPEGTSGGAGRPVAPKTAVVAEPPKTSVVKPAKKETAEKPATPEGNPAGQSENVPSGEIPF